MNMIEQIKADREGIESALIAVGELEDALDAAIDLLQAIIDQSSKEEAALSTYRTAIGDTK